MTFNVLKILRERKIPSGMYCYDSTSGRPFKHCPYFTTKVISGVRTYYCKFLKMGDVGNISNEEFTKLKEYFACTEEDMNDIFPLMLLWDSVKECSINLEDDYA